MNIQSISTSPGCQNIYGKSAQDRVGSLGRDIDVLDRILKTVPGT